MSNQIPFSLRIFVADGDPDGLRLVERSNWSGKAVMFPRALLPDVRGREEFQQTGVYLLLGPRPKGDGEMLYIGEADPIRPRLDQHYAKKDFWARAVFFVAQGGQLNKAHVKYLESRLITLATEAKRTPLDNATQPTEPTLSEADKADMEVFLQTMLGILPVLGIHAFEKSIIERGVKMKGALRCRVKGVEATGYDTPQGFVVRSGSTTRGDQTSLKEEDYPRIWAAREDLIQSGVLEQDGKKLRMSQDYTFSSPSMASSVLLGRTSNGRTAWIDAAGKTLKQLQEAQAAE
jgi:hypothetical protein